MAENTTQENTNDNDQAQKKTNEKAQDSKQANDTERNNPSGNSSDNTQNPSREESLKGAGKASPSSEDGGLEDGTQVLGQEGQSHEDRLDEARRDALNNAKGDQDLNP